MMKLRALVLTMVIMAASPVVAETDMQLLFNCTSKRLCVIRANGGGIPFLFEEAAKEVLRDGTHVRIDGRCASSCVIFASRARTQVCLTKNAQMAIHRGTVTRVYTPSGKEVNLETEEDIKTYLKPPPGYRTEVTRYTPDYGDDINAWAFRENKMPYDGFYAMTWAEALRFWKPCR